MKAAQYSHACVIELNCISVYLLSQTQKNALTSMAKDPKFNPCRVDSILKISFRSEYPTISIDNKKIPVLIRYHGMIFGYWILVKEMQSEK